MCSSFFSHASRWALLGRQALERCFEMTHPTNNSYIGILDPIGLSKKDPLYSYCADVTESVLSPSLAPQLFRRGLSHLQPWLQSDKFKDALCASIWLPQSREAQDGGLDHI